MRSIQIAFCLLMTPFLVYADPLSLTEALKLGMKQNQQLRSARAQTEAARFAARLAASRGLPQLSFSEDFVWTNEPGTSLFISLNQQRLQLYQDANAYNYPSSHTDFQSRLQLKQSLYNPDIRYGRQAAEKQADVAAAMEQAGEETLALNILRTYLDVQHAQALLSWAEVSLAETRELLRLATEREDAGTGLKADRLNVEARVAASSKQLLGSQNQLLVAQWRLATQVGEDTPQQIAAPLTLDRIRGPVEDAPELRPDLLALERQTQAAAINRRQAAAGWQPRLHAGASWTLHDRDYPLADRADSWMVGAGLTWVLFDGFGRSHALDQAQAEERSLTNRFRYAMRQARFEETTARLNSEILQQQLQASEIALAATEESYRLMRTRYRNGLTPLVELLVVQASLEKCRVDLSNSQVQLIFNQAQQHYLQGTLLQALLPEESTK